MKIPLARSPGQRLAKNALVLLSLISATSSATAQDMSTSIDIVQQRVVKIFGAGGLSGLHAYGTGLLVSPEGHVATVWSHLLDADVATVVLWDGRRYVGKLIGTDVEKDVAVLKIEADGLPCFDLTKSATASPGARVLAFSNMFKVASGDEPVTVQRGVIAARSRLDARRGRFEAPYRGPVYVIDAVTNNPGAAGGALTTLDGRLIAMLGRELKNSQTQTWLNYAVPMSELTDAILAIEKGETRPQENPGADPDNANAISPMALGLVLVPDIVARTPAYIDEVLADSAAAKAGLAPEDLIVFLNSDLVGSVEALNEALAKLAPGDDVQLTVRRGDDLVTVTIRVPNRPGDR
jgi:serine protease Do